MSDGRWPVGEGAVSKYPFAAIDFAEGVGLTLAVPPTEPRVFRITYHHQTRTGSWLRLKFYFGLTPRTRNFPSAASFSFILYRHDPNWGIRSSAERFYGFFPRCYEVRLKEPIYQGYAFEFRRRRSLKNPDDFGRIFSRYVGHYHLCYTGAFSYEDKGKVTVQPHVLAQAPCLRAIQAAA